MHDFAQFITHYYACPSLNAVSNTGSINNKNMRILGNALMALARKSNETQRNNLLVKVRRTVRKP